MQGLRIGFGKPSANSDPVIVNDIPLEVVPCNCEKNSWTNRLQQFKMKWSHLPKATKRIRRAGGKIISGAPYNDIIFKQQE